MFKEIETVAYHCNRLGITEGELIECIFNGSTCSGWHYSDFEISEGLIRSKKRIGVHEYFDSRLKVTICKL